MSPSRSPRLEPWARRVVVSHLHGRQLVVTLLALGAMSCSITEPSSRSDDQLELTRNRQRWISAGIHDYAFDYQLLCFCAPAATEPVRITVRQDAVVEVVRQRDGLPAGTNNAWPVVDALFDDIQNRLDQHVARITVDYDPTYGYPRSIAVDIAAMAADDEYSHTAGNLRPLP